MTDQPANPVIVLGASRGLGRAIATTLADAGHSVVAVARTESALSDLESEAPTIQPEIADAGRPDIAATLLERYDPRAIVLVAGATPHMLPLHEQTWETFSVNWETDVRIAFQWLAAALRKPLRPDSRMVVFSSGAALNPNGSPLSGGYAGAKQTQRFITGYAQDESNRANLGIQFTTVMPQFAPETGVGTAAVAGYANQTGLSVEDYLKQLPYPLLTPEIAGSSVLELVTAEQVAPAYLLNGAGLTHL